MALFGLLIRMALRLAWTSDQAIPSRMYWLPALVALAYALDNLFLGQTNILMTAMIYWTFLELARGREWRAGGVLGASVAMKVFTFPLIAYLLYRGRWRALAGTLVAVAFFLLLLPAPVRGFHRNLDEVKDWGNRVVAPYLTRGEAGDWGQHALDFGNQSLPSVLNRLLRPVDAGVEARGSKAWYVNLASLPESQINVIVVIAFGLLAAVFMLAGGWKRDPRRFVIEAAMATILLLLVSAIAWTYFFVALLFPAAVALALIHQGIRPRLLTVALWMQAVAVALLGSSHARAWGSVCWAALMLYLALAAACWSSRRVSGRNEGNIY
jgi:hypothetical protein